MKKDINKLQKSKYKIYNFDTPEVWKGIDAIQSGVSSMSNIILLVGILIFSIWFSLKLVVITFLCLSGVSFFYNLIKYIYYQNKWLKMIQND
jgi:hypothetical protein